MAEAEAEESSVMLCTCGGIGDPYSIIMNKVTNSSSKLRRVWFSKTRGSTHVFLFSTRATVFCNQGPKPELGVPWYGTRYGHNIAEQVKQHMIQLNVSRVTELHYTNCTGAASALRIKIDFEDFRMNSYFKVRHVQHFVYL